MVWGLKHWLGMLRDWKKDRHRDNKSWGQVVFVHSDGVSPTPPPPTRTSVWLLRTAQEKFTSLGRRFYKQQYQAINIWKEEAVVSILCTPCSVMHKHLYLASEGSIAFPNLTHMADSFASPQWDQDLRVPAWLSPCQQYTFTQNFTHSGLPLLSTETGDKGVNSIKGHHVHVINVTMKQTPLYH